METGIFRILSKDLGPSQSKLLDELIKYSEMIREYDLVLKPDKANLSRKLKSLEEKAVVFYKIKKLTDRDQFAYSYYIKKDLIAFEYIIKHLSKDLDTALDVSPSNTQGWKKLFEIKDDKPRDLTLGAKCGQIDVLIRSAYVKQLIMTCGFKSVYQIYKKEVNGYCDMTEFIKLAVSLVHEGSINDLNEFGPEFKSDAESRKMIIEAINLHFPKTS